MRTFLRVFLLLGITHSVESQTSINAAFRKPVSANITCGSPAEEYYTTLDKDKLPANRVAQTCDANDPKNAHPPSYLVDGSLATFWQSTARKSAAQQKAYIQIDLQQKFFAREIKLSFGIQRRPKAIKISRSDSIGAPFQPYHYLVERPLETQSTCRDNFGVDVHVRGVIIDRVDKVLCQYYENYYPKDYNETITVDLTRRSRGVQNAEFTSEVLAWLSVASLRFTFLDMNYVLSNFFYRFHHYTVREIEFLARCDCKGHGDGSNCPQNETTKQRSCVCQNNTCGENCEKCCPLYNQKPWTAGSKAPWDVDTSFSCERCNCHNHSDLCVYNQTVNDLKLSLDIHGNRSGGGVCQDCKNHTRGINCEKCEEHYYRPRGRDHKREDACKACMCDDKGTKNVTTLAFMDCVSDETELSQHPGKEPGDCYCKANVHGSKCNQCKPEFFNLAKENPDGCMSCNCHQRGTVNASNVCDTSSTGQCSCKKNVELRDCSQCKHGYYNMRNESADGCQSCDCDEGGTYPENKCNQVTGQCQCRANIINRVCDKPRDGYFYPEVHHFSASKDPYKNATNDLYVDLSIPKTSRYRIIIITTENVLVRAAEIASIQTNSSIFTWRVMKTCIDSGYCNISAGTYGINITDTGAKKVVKIVAIPEDYIEATILGSDRTGSFKFQCDVIRNDMSSNEKLCKAGVFSLTSAFLNGTLPCACNIEGSVNHTTCKEYGGQCSCKTGVEGRDCSRCKPGYYNLTAEGCKPCSCKGPHSVCDPNTGMCECPANTIGRTCEPCQCNNNSNKCSRNGDCFDCQHNTTGLRCERCVNMTYGDALTQQCRACDCNATGSVGSYCDVITGQCICKSKISGRACDICQNNTFGFGSSGCTDCGCNMYGSESQQCNVSGHCQCKTGAGGMKCSTCTTGYYGLPAKACQACNCNATGTLNGTVCANDAIGQCKCKPGVTGRACDRCDKYFSNFTDQGCSACPDCVMELTKMVEKTVAQSNDSTDKGDLLKALASLHTPLTDTESFEGRTAVNLKAFIQRLNEAGKTYDSLTQTVLASLNETYYRVHDENAVFMANGPSVSEKVASELNRTKDIHMRTEQTDSVIKDLDSLLQSIVKTFTAQVQYGNQVIRSANESVTRHMIRDFSSQQDIVDMNTRDADNLTSFVAMVAKQLLNQTSLATKLNSDVQHNRGNLSQLLIGWNATHAHFLHLIASIRHQFSGIRDVMKDTQAVLVLEGQRLQEARQFGNDSNHILNMTKNTLHSAVEAFESFRAMVTAVTGEIQISMLKYNDEGNRFALKVLGARDLSSRDLPSKSADPYVLISFIPNDHGTKRSTTKKGTLNPTWGQFEQIFEFNIAHEQLKKSKLKVRVLDEDPEDTDDFMGEVTIDLSVVGDAEFTKWYPLRSVDVSTLESGDFQATSGLSDVSNLLQVQKNKMTAILSTLDTRLRLAHQNAQLMKNQAEALQREYATVQGHGDIAVKAIKRFDEIERLINNSMDTLSRAQSVINTIASKMDQKSASALLDMARQEQTLASRLYTDAIKRNLSENGVAHVEEYLTRLNDSLKYVVPMWHQAYSQYPDLVDAANRLKLAAKDAPSAYDAITKAQTKCKEYEQVVQNVVKEVNGVEGEVNSLLKKITFIQSSAQRDSSLIQEAYLHVNNASENMNKSQESVQEAIKINQTLTEQRENISNTLTNVEKRLNDLKKRLSQLDLGLKIKKNSEAVYSMVASAPTPHNDISLIVKTNSSEGRLLNMSGSTSASQRSRRSLDGQSAPASIILSLKNGFIQATFNVGKGEITLINTLRVNDGLWHQIDFTRQGSMGTLTVESSTQSRTVTHNSGDLESKIQFKQGDTVVLGEQEDSNSYGVVISDLKIDQYPFLLWEYKTVSGEVKLAQPRYPNVYIPDNGLAATFDTAKTWSQEIMLPSNYLEVEFEFRTFEGNGVLMSTSYNDVTELVLYLKNGHVYAELKNGSDIDVIQSERTKYNNGKWYQVKFSHDEKRNLLNITHNNVVIDAITNATSLTGHRLHATHLSLGSVSSNTSTKGLKEISPFLGDMQDFKLSNEKAKSLHQVSFKQSAHVGGVYTSYVIAGQVEPGAARFYGFTKATNKCSYVSINNTKTSATSLSFAFKTLKKNELLLYSKTMARNKTVFLYIALWHGNLQILNHESTGSNEETKPYMTSGISFADNIWREVYINSSAEGYSLYVNNSLIYSGWFGNSRQIPFDLSNPLYIGGLPPSVAIPLKAKTTNCFQGAMKAVKIDDMDIDLFSHARENVINGGVLPGRSPPPPPPTCAAPAGPITHSTDKSTVGFVSGFSGVSQGYLQISNGVQLKDYFLWTLRLRPLSSNGLVFYIADNLTHPGQFMSLELIDGKLTFQVNGNPGLVYMATKIDYINIERTNSFLTISGLYVSKGKFGAMLIYETQEYHNYQIKNATSATLLNLTGPLFFGGVPNNVKLHPLVTQRSGFSGCINSFEYHSSSSSPKSIDLSKPSESHKTQSCVSNAVAGFGLNRTSWLKFGNVSLNTKTMDIQLDFRTSSRQGIVFHLVSNNTRQGHESYLRLEQVNGQLVLTYKNASSYTRKVTWSADSSYFLCNMTWHTVKLKGSDNNLQLTIDQSSSVSLSVSMDDDLKGDLYVGGMPASISSPPTGFAGCIKGLKLSNKVLDYGRATDGMQVTNGCAKTGTTQQSNNVLAR